MRAHNEAMRFGLPTALICATVLLSGCGDSAPGQAEESAAPGGATAGAGPTKKVSGTAKPPPLEVPPGPPPKQVVVKDLRKGEGAEIQATKGFTASYIALDYGSGKQVEANWGDSAFKWFWRRGELSQGWEIGLEGLRVGGLRKLVVPSRLAYDSGARVYLVELLEVE